MLTRLTVHPTKQHKSSGSIFVTAESRLYKASKRFTAFAEMLGIDRGGMLINPRWTGSDGRQSQPGSAARNCRKIKRGGRGRLSDRPRLQKLFGVRLQSYSNLVVDSYFTRNAKRGSRIIILPLVLVLLVIAIYGFLGISTADLTASQSRFTPQASSQVMANIATIPRRIMMPATLTGSIRVSCSTLQATVCSA
ncbi:hypothetical protein CDO30_22855 (plasmid) [Sinorhizobium meliloti]|uniref:Uncharacterized protein n=1 Tax=Rhizobium meliloti (strain 1021) TaxID=266834 RepID=Q92XW5_RHIME|nr:hypothetical protein SMa2059 [Sinorhizobium meliloti 1021]AGG70824.1 Hypothetical protein SM2011_a2059 [Sinorhizobium meliloti 2011]ASP61061.1 hypothetical protein CDO30_22855 [Sinorhizobium meliloti]MQW43065.1 hypothetical protein [Sinorhizobium meliloti]RVL23636.1 hypothetical protein CN147_19120 [Sinorhizobium meliloti]